MPGSGVTYVFNFATALWVHENRKQYAEGIFRGFEATEGSDAECADKQE
jgi:hypothetical protein